MKIETWKLDRIRPYANNPRLNDDAVDAVAASERGDEAWVSIPDYEGLYEVSSHGRVRRSSRSRMSPAGHILKPRLTWDGYLAYSLCKHRRYWHVKAHRLVALAFFGPPPFPKAHVAHCDGNRLNNHVGNLRWATGRENEADKKRHGTARGAPPGEMHPQARLTSARVAEMRRLAASGMPITAIAAHVGIAKLTAYDAIVGITWRTLTEPPPLPRRRRIES